MRSIYDDKLGNNLAMCAPRNIDERVEKERFTKNFDKNIYLYSRYIRGSCNMSLSGRVARNDDKKTYWFIRDVDIVRIGKRPLVPRDLSRGLDREVSIATRARARIMSSHRWKPTSVAF